MKLRSAGSLFESQTSLLLKESDVFKRKTSKSLSKSEVCGVRRPSGTPWGPTLEHQLLRVPFWMDFRLHFEQFGTTLGSTGTTQGSIFGAFLVKNEKKSLILDSIFQDVFLIAFLKDIPQTFSMPKRDEIVKVQNMKNLCFT